MINDTYLTIAQPSPESLFKDKGSKFLGYAFPIFSESEILPIIEKLKKEHHKARHWCYAWRLGSNYQHYRINDDGEPSGSAGLPIYGQIQSKNLTHVLVVVVRYFGGTKLGVSGLITAYKSAAMQCLEQATIIEKTIDSNYKLTFEYTDMNKVQRVLKQFGVNIVQQNLEVNCQFTVSIRRSEAHQFIKSIEELRCVKLEDLT